ncbi:RNA-directed DNA polymerase, eukaryota [Tanacetum coccineum]
MGDEVWKEVSCKKRRAGFDKLDLPSIQTKPYMGKYRSKEDDLEKISVSVFITNIPDSCSAKELFNACKQYGHVVDSFIPNKRSKAGKRFGFVKFINVFNEERLVDNLGTVWIGRYRLHANLAKFRRPSVGEAKKVGYETVGSKSNRGQVEVDKGTNVPISSVKSPAGSFVNVVKGNPPMPCLPSLVLDESCINKCDLSRHVMGKVKDINSIPNLHTLLYKEGFPDVKLSYLGGMWVMLELGSVSTQHSLLLHTGVNSWFQILQPAVHDFVSEERVVWVDIEGVPLKFWSRETFVKIGKKWGEAMDIDESLSSSFARKRLCIKTNLEDNILEKFKVVFRGKTKGEVFDSDVEGVPDTIFEDNIVSPIKSVCHSSGKEGEHFSEDPFGIYEMLNRNPTHVAKELDPSLSHPPGFTPVESQQEETNGGDKELPNSAAPNVVNNSEVPANESCNGESDGISSLNSANGGSFLDVMDGLVRVGQSMGYKMDGCLKDLENIIGNHGDSNSGGILCIWEASVFKKEFVTISDNFVAIYGSWCSNNSKLLIVVVYAPQSSACKRLLWEYISSLITRWNGETIVMGDFNVVRSTDERLGSRFNQSSAKVFNQFIESSGLVDIKLEGYSFTWSHPSGRKMSKLDRFLVSEGIVSLFPSISATCLDKHLSDHRPILLHEVNSDFGPSPFRMFHSWFRRDGFDLMVEQAWCSFSHNDGNSLIRFKKKLQALKIIIRRWIKSKNLAQSGIINSIKEELIEIDKIIDSGSVNDELLLKRMDLSRQLFDTKHVDSCDSVQKSKIKWGIEGDENSKYFHGIINKKRSQLAIRGVLVDGDWCIDPGKVKDVFMQHFAARFKKPNSTRFKLNFVFPNRLSDEQVENMDQLISRDEIKSAVWSCGENKSPGPDGYTFEFFRRYWNFIGPDLCSAVECFFDKGSFPMGNNASFIALIPKVPDAKYVTDYRPISLIGSVYKVITKVLANRLATVVSDLVSDTQSAFVANRQILDGPFILNEVLTWCKRKRKQAMIFKVDFAKAYDSVRWDYLMEVLQAFGFGPNWCKWVRGTLSSAMASVLINGSPSEEFAFYRGLKQGDPLAPFLFILVMESLHLSFTRTVNEGLFTGLQLNESMTISHLFYADDAVFIGEWSDSNMENIVIILKSFFLASGLKINIQKSHIMGVGVADGLIHQAASLIGCAIMKTPFRYLGVLVGNNSLRCSAWSDTIHKLWSRLSKWKVKTLSVGGRLTLLKSVLGASPIYNLSIYKAPITVLKEMERIRSNFFKGADYNDRKISWVSWDKVLASKKVGGLGVSSYYALNHALILKWVWHFVSQDGSLWFRVIQALYGTSLESHQIQITSLWSSILREMHVLGLKGFDLMAHCKKRIGDGNNTSFWRDS